MDPDGHIESEIVTFENKLSYLASARTLHLVASCISFVYINFELFGTRLVEKRSYSWKPKCHLLNLLGPLDP